MEQVTEGATSGSYQFEILDSTSTTGGRKTGLAYNTAGLTAYYVRAGGSATAITLATLAAANSAFSSGGFKEIDATNMPGMYRLDVPDAAFAAGAKSVTVTVKGATGGVQVSRTFQLNKVDLRDAVRGGMTALPNAAADAAGGLVISDAGGLDADAQRADVAAILVDTGTTLDARIPAALVSGRMDSSTGAMAANVMTAAAAAADLTTELQNGLATAAALDAVDNFLDTEVAAILAAVDTEVAAIITTLGTPAGVSISADIAAIEAQTDDIGAAGAGLTAVPWNAAWDAEVQSEAQDAITASALATAANLATVAGYLDTEIAAIKAKTDSLTFTVANQVDSNVLTGGGSGLDAAATRAAIGMAAADLDTQLAAKATAASIAALNDVSTAQVRTEARGAIADYGGIL